MSWTFLSESTPKARKDHSCILCDQAIPTGATHVARRGIDHDGPVTIRMHTECEAETKGWDDGDWESNDPGEFAAYMKRKSPAPKVQP
jgi:hypothetical protein